LYFFNLTYNTLHIKDFPQICLTTNNKWKESMKNSLLLLSGKILLKQRALIESVNDELKNICQI